MIRIKNQQRKIQVNLPRTERTIRKILKALTFPYTPELSLLFVNDERIRKLNHRYRGIDRATDVLSFTAKLHPPSSPLTKVGIEEGYPLARGESSGLEVLGDIVISLPTVFCQAKERGITFYEELDFTFIHSILHLLGYTHDTESKARRMRKKEKEILLRIKGAKGARIQVKEPEPLNP